MLLGMISDNADAMSLRRVSGHKLIPNIRVWLERGNIGRPTTKLFTRHGGCYRWYLHHFDFDDSPNCGIPDEPEYVLFHCPKLAMKGRNVNRVWSVSLEELVAEMQQKLVANTRVTIPGRNIKLIAE